MSSISLNSLFQSLEAQVGKEALLAAFAAYSPDAPAAAPAAKPKRVGKPLTEEHKAKLAAGRAAAKAKKEAAKASAAEPADAAPAAEPPAKEDGNESTSSSQKKRGPKAKKDMTPDELEAHNKKVAERKAKKAAKVPAASVPLPASSDEAEKPDPSVFAESVIKGTKYLRNFRGDLLTEGYEWVGRYNGKTIDTTFPKPADLEDDE
jgi:hypothetical protein